MCRISTLAALVVVLWGCTRTTHAELTIETVTVGNPGNAGEWSGASHGGYGPDCLCGAVSYAFDIGKYEVTAGQYAEFLNAVAAEDPHGLYNVAMAYSPGCRILRDGEEGGYTYSVMPIFVNRPVNLVSWGDAARFANWLHNGQPTGPAGSDHHGRRCILPRRRADRRGTGGHRARVGRLLGHPIGG